VGELIGYARCSTVLQDLTAQREILTGLGVADDRIYLDKGLTGTNRARPGLDQALAAVRSGDTLVVPKLDRLARSVPDARNIGDTLLVPKTVSPYATCVYSWMSPPRRSRRRTRTLPPASDSALPSGGACASVR
jgi:hypothetical protein